MAALAKIAFMLYVALILQHGGVQTVECQVQGKSAKSRTNFCRRDALDNMSACQKFMIDTLANEESSPSSFFSKSRTLNNASAALLANCCNSLRTSAGFSEECRCALQEADRARFVTTNKKKKTQQRTKKIVALLNFIENNDDIGKSCGIQQELDCSVVADIFKLAIERQKIGGAFLGCEHLSKNAVKFCDLAQKQIQNGTSISKDIKSIECCRELQLMNGVGCKCAILDDKSGRFSDDVIGIVKLANSSNQLAAHCKDFSINTFDCALQKRVAAAKRFHNLHNPVQPAFRQVCNIDGTICKAA